MPHKSLRLSDTSNSTCVRCCLLYRSPNLSMILGCRYSRNLVDYEGRLGSVGHTIVRLASCFQGQGHTQLFKDL